MKKLLILCAFLTTLISSNSFAVWPHLPPPLTSFVYNDPGYTDNSLWLISPDWPSYVIGEVGFSPPESRWHIAQWGIDPGHPLLPTKSGGRNSWKVNTRDARIRVSTHGKQRMIDLWHSTEDPYYEQHQICYDPNSFYPSAEFDLIILPNMKDDPDLPNDADLPQNFLDYKNTPSLSQINLLYLQAQQRLVQFSTSYRCGYDSAVTGLAVVFINPITDPPQKFYYQLTTFDTRWPNQNTDGWFYNGEIFEGIANYGYDDSITDGYNLQPLVRHGSWGDFSLNIRDQVAHLINTSSNSIDKDLELIRK